MITRKLIIINVLILLFAIFCSYTSISQTYTRFLVQPENAIIHINGKKVLNGNLLSVDPIEYEVRVWAPNFKLKDTLIQIVHGRSVIKIELDLSEEFIEYRNSLKTHRGNIIKKRVVPVAGVAAGSLGIYLLARSQFLNPAKDLFLESTLEYERHTTVLDFGEIVESKEIIIQNEEEFLKLRKQYYIYTSVSVSTAIVGGYIVRKVSKKKNPLPKPVYEEVPLLTFESFGIKSFSGNGFGVSLNLNLN